MCVCDDSVKMCDAAASLFHCDISCDDHKLHKSGTNVLRHRLLMSRMKSDSDEVKSVWDKKQKIRDRRGIASEERWGEREKGEACDAKQTSSTQSLRTSGSQLSTTHTRTHKHTLLKRLA